MMCPPHSIGEVFCPNCRRETAFRLVYIHPRTRVFYDHRTGSLSYEPEKGKFKGIANCVKCKDTLLVEFSFPEGSMVFGLKVIEPYSFLLGKTGAGIVERVIEGTVDIEHMLKEGINLKPFIKIERIYPEDVSPSCPEYVPEDVCRYFIEAQKLLLECGSERFALVAFRLTIESAIRHILGEEKGPLRELIRKACKKGIIPGILADLADVIRVFGNVGAHPEELEPFINEVDEVYEFTKLFLELAFTYPERIKRLKSRFRK